MPVDLDELERLEREATPGPWELWEEHLYIFAGPAEENDPGCLKGARVTICKADFDDGEWEYQQAAERGNAVGSPESDFNLIATARNALPDLLAELRALRARVAELERTTPSLEWIDLRPAHEPMREMLALSYEQGRRDALRGVQAAALYRHAELWQGRMRLTLADERRDIEACELAWAAAQAAEEAAR